MESNLIDPSSFWRFVADNPEAMHFVTWLYSDIGTLSSLRHMSGYGVNTYVWKNARGVRHFVKYHWLPCAGQTCIDSETAARLAGENPDIAGEDLYRAISSGKPVEYDLCVQLMRPEDAKDLSFDPLDATKVWDEEAYPLMLVGRLSLNKNPDCYKEQIEKAAFSPSNLLCGIELSNDKLLQGRSNIYWDAQRYRIGTDFRNVPVNREARWAPGCAVTSGEGVYVQGELVRRDIRNTDDFSQASERYGCLDKTGRERLRPKYRRGFKASRP